jgi:hypothetical protein
MQSSFPLLSLLPPVQELRGRKSEVGSRKKTITTKARRTPRRKSEVGSRKKRFNRRKQRQQSSVSLLPLHPPVSLRHRLPTSDFLGDLGVFVVKNPCRLPCPRRRGHGTQGDSFHNRQVAPRRGCPSHRSRSPAPKGPCRTGRGPAAGQVDEKRRFILPAGRSAF